MKRTAEGSGKVKNAFSFQVEMVAIFMLFIFTWDQIVLADGILPQNLTQSPELPVVDATLASTPPAMTLQEAAPSTTQEFLSQNNSPLSAPTPAPLLSPDPPKILQIPNPMNGWKMKFTSQAGVNYEIQVSTNLRTWETLTVLKASSAETTWTDPSVNPGGMRFYRLGISDVVAPAVVVGSAAKHVTNAPSFTIHYTSDGIAKAKTFQNLTEGANTLTITETNLLGDQTIVNWNVTVDTISPVVKLVSPLSVTTSNYQLIYNVDGEIRTEDLVLVSGANDITRTVRDLAGNETTVVFQVTLTEPFPKIVVTSPNRVTSANYNLVYQVNGAQKKIPYTLHEGANLLSVEETSGSSKTVAHFLVILNALPGPTLPSDSFHLDFDLSGEAATLLSPTFSASGTLESGWLRAGAGDYYRLSNGVLAEEVKADGSRLFYDAQGRIHSKVTSDLDVTSFTYEVNAAGEVVRTIAREGASEIVLGPSGNMVGYHHPNGAEFFFLEGKLARIEQNGVTYQYSISVNPEGFECQIVSPSLPADSNFPQSLLYDPENRMIRMTNPDGTLFYFDPSGGVSRVMDPSGHETTYAPEMDPSGLIHGMTVTRQGLIRRYDSQGALKELTDSSGTVFGIQNSQVVSIRYQDGTFYDQLTYDSAGVLQNAQVHMPDGRTLFFSLQHLIKMALPDQTVIEFQNDKPSFAKMTDGRVYQYFEASGADPQGFSKSQLIEFRNQAGNRVLLTAGLVTGIEEVQGEERIVTTYAYDDQKRISEAVIKRNGVVTGRFVYQYGTGETQVTNQLGSIRYYDSHGKLTTLTMAQGGEYRFSSLIDAQGNSRVLQTLVRIVNPLSGTVDYTEGQPSAIKRPDNIEVADIVLGPGSDFSATVRYPSGATGIIQNGQLTQISETNGTVKLYTGGLLQRVTTSSLLVTTLSYAKDSSGNVVSVTVQDTLGSRTYTAAGVLASATKPDGTQITYDASGVLQRIYTPAKEELLYSNGSLNRINFLATQESLTGIVLDGNNNLAAGTFNASDGSRQIIQSGYLSKIIKPDNTVINFLSNGKASSIVTPAGNTISYSGAGTDPVTRIDRTNGSYAKDITTDAQDALVSAGIHLPDGFNGFVASGGKILSGYALVNGSIKKPGSIISYPFKQFISKVYNYNSTPGIGYSLEGSCGSSCINSGILVDPVVELSTAAYIKLKVTVSSVPFRFELYSLDKKTLIYSQVYTSLPDGDVYFEVPQGLAAFGEFRLVATTASSFSMKVSDLAFYNRSDFAPTDWTNLAVPYTSQKVAPSLLPAIGTVLQKKAGLESDANTFKSAATFNLSAVSEDLFFASSIRNSVSGAILPGSAIVTVLYDDQMNRLGVTHRDVAFNEASDPNGSWQVPVTGWEDVGYAFGPRVLAPADGTALEIGYESDGSVSHVSLQGSIAAHYQNQQVSQVITPDNKVLHYTYGSDVGNAALSGILIDPSEEDASSTEIRYAYGKIREILKKGVVVYHYAYEFGSEGEEIVVIEDVSVKEERRFLRDRLLSVKGLSTGFITSYTYDDSGHICRAQTERSGRVFATYTYTYENSDTVIRDDSGTLRRYGSDGLLQHLETSTGQIYDYSTLSDQEGEDLILQDLVRISTSLKGTADYVQGKPIKIITPGGIQLTNLILNADNSVREAIVQYPAPDNRIAIIQNGQVIHVTSSAAGVQIFQDGFLERYLSANGDLTVITYHKDSSGAVASITVEDKESTRVYSPSGVLLKATLPDMTQIDYVNGAVQRITCPSGDVLNYINGILDSILFSAGQGKVEQVLLNSDGSIRSGAFSKDGVELSIWDGRVIQKNTLDGTVFNYFENGAVSSIVTPAGNAISYSGTGTDTVTRIDRSSGAYAANITTGAQDALVSAEFHLADGFNGFVASGGKIVSGYSLINETIKKPGGLIIYPFSQFLYALPNLDSTPRLAYSIDGRCGGSCTNAGILVDPVAELGTAAYIKLNVNLSSVPFCFELYGADKSTLLFSQVYTGLPSGDVYFEVPQGLPAFGEFRLVATTASAFSMKVSDLAFYSRADFAATDWTNIAVPYVSQKRAPSVPAVIRDKLILRSGLENSAARQFTLTTPTQADSGDGGLICAQIRDIVNARVLDKDTVIASAYRKSDGEILMVANADQTVAHYANGTIDKVTDHSGTLVIDYEYDGANDLTRVFLVQSRDDLAAQNLEAQNEIAKQKEEALMQLAVAKGKAVGNIQQILSDALANIEAQRQSLRDQSEQKVCRKVLFWKSCQTVTVDISGPMAQLDQAERDARDGAAAQLASLDTSIASQKQQMEQDASKALVELEKQRMATYQELVKQELRPVIYHYYRKILGRDPDQVETNARLALVLASERVNCLALANELTASAEHATRLATVNQIKAAVRTFLKDSYLPAGEIARDDMTRSLGLLPADVVHLTEAEVDTVLNWIDSRDLHFGHSAFLSIQQLMRESGKEVSLLEIAQEAILIDILTGIIHPLTTGDLELSLFSLQTVAKIHLSDHPGVQFTAARIDFEELKRELTAGWSEFPGQGKGILTHINGNHYVVVTKVELTQKTDDAGKLVFDGNGNAVMVEMVTYQESNAGPEGEVVRISKEEFLKLWAVTGEQAGVVLTPMTLAPQAHILNSEETKQIRGAFFPIIIGIFLAFIFNAIAAAITIAIAAVVALVTTIITVVASILSMVAQVILQIGQGLIYLAEHFFAGVRFVSEGLLRGLYSGFSFLKEGLASFGKFLTFPGGPQFASGALTPGQIVARQVIGVAVSLGSGKTLDKLGVSPTIANLAGAFITGGVIGLVGGALSLGTTMISSGLQSLAISGVNELALHIGLPPPVSSMLSLISGTLAGTLTNPSQLPEAFRNLMPMIGQELVMTGVAGLGNFLGIDPRIAKLIGLPIATAVGGITRDLFSRSGAVSSLWRSIQDTFWRREVVGGLVSLGAEFVVDKLGLDRSIFTAFSSRIVAGIMGDFLTQGARLSLVDSIIKSIDNSIYHALDPKNLPALVQAIREKGFAGGFDQYATAILSRDTIEEFTSAGMTFTRIIAEGLPFARDIFFQSGPAKVLQSVKNGKTIEFIFRTLGDGRLQILGIHEKNQNMERLTQWNMDAQGNITSVTVEERMPDGTKRKDTLSVNGDLQKIEFRDWENQTFATLTYNPQGAIEFNNYNLGIAGHLSAGGKFQFNLTAAPDLQDFDNLIYDFDVSNLGAQKQGQFFTLFTGNGFWNEHGAWGGVPQLSIDFIHNITEDQARNGIPAFVLLDEHGNIAHDTNGNVLTTASLPVTLYSETGLIGNARRWSAETWFGCNFMRDKIESDLRNYFDLIDLNIQKYGLDPGVSNIYFAHSGNFQPLIKALEDMDPKYQQRLKTVIVYEGPYVGDGIINDPYLQALIRVRGSADGLSVPFLDHRNFEIADQNGNRTPLPNQYNIEIAGAGHCDFDARTNPKVNLFMRDLSLVANDQVKRDRFLSVVTPGITIENGLIKLDPELYVSPNGDRL